MSQMAIITQWYVLYANYTKHWRVWLLQDTTMDQKKLKICIVLCTWRIRYNIQSGYIKQMSGESYHSRSHRKSSRGPKGETSPSHSHANTKSSPKLMFTEWTQSRLCTYKGTGTASVGRNWGMWAKVKGNGSTRSSPLQTVCQKNRHLKVKTHGGGAGGQRYCSIETRHRTFTAINWQFTVRSMGFWTWMQYWIFVSVHHPSAFEMMKLRCNLKV